MCAPPKAFTFEGKNNPGVTSTPGPHKPRHHYKTEVPKVPNPKPEALRGRDRVPAEKYSSRECSAGPSAATGRATRARPFRSEPPSPGGRATGRASTRARGFAAYPRRCPLAQSGSGGSSDSPPSPAARPERAAGSRRRPPGLGPAGSPRTQRRQRRPRPWPPLPHRPGPTAAATRAAAPTSGPTAGPRRPWRGGGAGLLPTPPAPAPAGPLLLAPGRAAPPPVRTRRPSARAEAADGSGRPWS